MRTQWLGVAALVASGCADSGNDYRSHGATLSLDDRGDGWIEASRADCDRDGDVEVRDTDGWQVVENRQGEVFCWTETTSLLEAPSVDVRYVRTEETASGSMEMPAIFEITAPADGAEVPGHVATVTWSPTGAGEPLAAILSGACDGAGGGSLVDSLDLSSWPSLTQDRGALAIDLDAIGLAYHAGGTCSLWLTLSRDRDARAASRDGDTLDVHAHLERRLQLVLRP